MEAKRQKLSHIRLESVLPDDLTGSIPIVEVYTATISDPRNISKAIVDINEKLPVGDLQHLKRMKSREILLFPVSYLSECTTDHTNDTKLNVMKFLDRKNISTEYLDTESIKSTSVASIPPKTRRQYLAVNKLWPCNFHSNKYLEKLVENTLFSSRELETHTRYLKLTLDISKLSNCHSEEGDKCASGVIVTDPTRKDVAIAGGFSLTAKNPILHAPMVAIDGVAKTQNGGAYSEYNIGINWGEVLQGEFHDVKVLGGSRSNISEENNSSKVSPGVPSEEKQMKTNGCYDPGENEYYCTNYNVYLSHEPCIMCAMGLIHSRAKRIFYVHPSQNGGLGSACKIHAVKDLNHHYEVFRVLGEDLEYFQ